MKISIVTISYNQGRYLDATIRSVIGQRDDGIDVEYIVVDAGSRDASREILASYGTQIDQVVLEPDMGPADGLNKGFSRATGDVFGFINADDLLEPHGLEVVDRWMTANAGFDVVTGALRTVDADGQPFRRCPVLCGSVLFPPRFTIGRYLDRNTAVLQPSTFFRRAAWEATEGFNVENGLSWDGELFGDMLMAGVSFGRLPRVLASIRLHADSITNSSQLDGSPLARERQSNDRRRREKLVAAGFRGSPSLYRWTRALAWRARPVNRLRGLYLEAVTERRRG